jgi:hypothetical protein
MRKKKSTSEPTSILTIPGLQSAGWPAFLGIAVILIGILAFPVAFDIRFYFVQVGILIMFYATLVRPGELLVDMQANTQLVRQLL